MSESIHEFRLECRIKPLDGTSFPSTDVRLSVPAEPPDEIRSTLECGVCKQEISVVVGRTRRSLFYSSFIVISVALFIGALVFDSLSFQLRRGTLMCSTVGTFAGVLFLVMGVMKPWPNAQTKDVSHSFVSFPDGEHSREKQ